MSKLGCASVLSPGRVVGYYGYLVAGLAKKALAGPEHNREIVALPNETLLLMAPLFALVPADPRMERAPAAAGTNPCDSQRDGGKASHVEASSAWIAARSCTPSFPGIGQAGERATQHVSCLACARRRPARTAQLGFHA